jgi:excisionase family DNA binding protein
MKKKTTFLRGMNKTIHATTAPASAGEIDILTEDQLAKLLAVKCRTLRLWRKTRALPHIRISSRAVRFRRRDVVRWLEHNSVTVAA